jgi:hypothetical protein
MWRMRDTSFAGYVKEFFTKVESAANRQVFAAPLFRGRQEFVNSVIKIQP